MRIFKNILAAKHEATEAFKQEQSDASKEA